MAYWVDPAAAILPQPPWKKTTGRSPAFEPTSRTNHSPKAVGSTFASGTRARTARHSASAEMRITTRGDSGAAMAVPSNGTRRLRALPPRSTAQDVRTPILRSAKGKAPSRGESYLRPCFEERTGLLARRRAAQLAHEEHDLPTVRLVGDLGFVGRHDDVFALLEAFREPPEDVAVREVLLDVRIGEVSRGVALAPLVQLGVRAVASPG